MNEKLTPEQLAKVSETATVASRGLGKMAAEITPMVVMALAYLRAQGTLDEDAKKAVDILDNAGVFAAIDEATGYDVDPGPERVSKCKCLAGPTGRNNHHPNCPGNPAEYGDSAYVQVGSDEWHRRMGQALAQTPLYAHRVEAPAGKCSCHKDSWAPAGSHRGSCQSGDAK